jgi:hypothetical protein
MSLLPVFSGVCSIFSCLCLVDHCLSFIFSRLVKLEEVEKEGVEIEKALKEDIKSMLT